MVRSGREGAIRAERPRQVAREASPMADAARKTGQHSCPSHHGGPILTGSPNVLITGQPAARLIELQKKVSAILGINLMTDDES